MTATSAVSVIIVGMTLLAMAAMVAIVARGVMVVRNVVFV
jgi:hypothetical protein